MKTRTEKICIVFALLFVCVGCSLAHADDSLGKSEVTEPVIPQFKAGDKIYLSISGNVPRMVIYQSPVGKDEFNNKGFSKDDGYPDNLIPYDDKIDVRVWSRSGSNHEVMRINAKKLLDSIAENIKKNPTDKKKWQRKWVQEEWVQGEANVTFKFAGIQRFFRLQSIKVPPQSELRKRTEYNKDGILPLLRLRVDVDSVERTCIDTNSNNKGWSAQFARNSASNRFELREGCEENLYFYLKDRNTTWPSRERNLTDFSDLKFKDVKSGTVCEDRGDLGGGKDYVTVLEFQEITE